MIDRRIPKQAHRPIASAHFRCPVCQTMVVAGPHGLCPNCSYLPPQALRLPSGPVRWRAPGVSGHYWLGVLAVSRALGFALALAAVGI